MAISPERLAELAADPAPLLRAVGEIAVAHSVRAFRDQRYGPDEWPARYGGGGRPNLAGIAADLNAGREPHADRFTSRPAGIDTGRLRDSIAYQIEGDDSITVGSMLDYAFRVHAGGISLTPITAKVVQGVRARIPRWEAQGKIKAGQLDRLMTVGELTTEVQPRPFVGMTDELRQEIIETVRAYLGDD